MDRTKEISKEETILGTTERKNMKEEMVDNSHLLSSQKKKKNQIMEKPSSVHSI